MKPRGGESRDGHPEARTPEHPEDQPGDHPEDHPDAHGEALAALRRTAFLLERAQESSYRIAAFRGAAATVASVPAGDLEDRAAGGRLRELPGIGERTAAMVADVVAGKVPAYLTDLEQRAQAPDPDGAPLRALVRGDLHSHTDASDGASPLEEMARTATELGHEYLAVTDHSPRLTVANGLSAERLREQVARIARWNDRGVGVRLLTGIEVDILDDGSLDQDPALLHELDVVVASLHSGLRGDRATVTRRLLGAIADPRTDVLGHVTGRRVRGRQRPPSELDARAVFEACAEHGVAVEINSRPDREDPPDELLALAVEVGCLFSIDSDAHAPGQLDFVERGCGRAVRAGIPAERVITTWPVAELLDSFG